MILLGQRSIAADGLISMGESTSGLSFVNLVKAATVFSRGNPAEWDTNGYPLNGTLSAARYATAQFHGSEYAGSYIIKWTGTGAMQLQSNQSPTGFTVIDGAEFVSGGTSFNLNTTGTNGRVEFTFNAPHATASWGIVAGTFSGFGNVVICRSDHEALVDAGEYFNPDYIVAYQELNPRIVRPMGWTNPNNSNNLGHWDYRGKPEHCIWSSRFEPNIWVGDISGTDTYTCGASPTQTTLTHLMTIQGKFLNDNTTTAATLNFNGTGAKQIVGLIFEDIGVGGVITDADGLVTLVYDAELKGGAGAWCRTPGGLTTRMPLEVLVAFANKLRTDLWTNFNHHVTDACVASQTQYVRGNLSPGLVWMPEFSNEIWNSVSGFEQTSYARQKGIALGFTTNQEASSWYAKRVAEIMPIVTSNWSGRAFSELKRVMAFQAFGNPGQTETYRWLGSDLSAYGFNTAPNRPIDLCDVVSYATYYSGAQLRNFPANFNNTMTDLLDAADDYDSGNPSLMSAALDWVDSDVRAGSRNGTPGGETLLALTAIYDGWETKAAIYGKEVACYEGGFECGTPGTARLTTLGIDTAYEAKISALLTAYKNDTRFQTLVTDQINQFMARASSTHPSWLIMKGPNLWGTHVGEVTAGVTFKSWDALVALNNS